MDKNEPVYQMKKSSKYNENIVYVSSKGTKQIFDKESGELIEEKKEYIMSILDNGFLVEKCYFESIAESLNYAELREAYEKSKSELSPTKD